MEQNDINTQDKKKSKTRLVLGCGGALLLFLLTLGLLVFGYVYFVKLGR